MDVQIVLNNGTVGSQVTMNVQVTMDIQVQCRSGYEL